MDVCHCVYGCNEMRHVLVWRSQTLGFDRARFTKGLVCPAYCTRVKLRESCKTNQIAVLLISA